MSYKEYKAKEGKVLLNIDTFSWGNVILCGDAITLNLIEVNKEDADYYSKKYYEDKNKILLESTDINDPQPFLMKTKTINTGLSSEMDIKEFKINELKTKLLDELMAKGYNLNAVGTPESNIEEHIRGLLNE